MEWLRAFLDLEVNGFRPPLTQCPIEEVVEPFLLQQGLIQRTPRGRVLGAKAWSHLGLAAPKTLAQNDLFEGK